MALSLCGDIIKTRRGLLAFGWSIVTLLTLIAFIIAFAFALTSKAEDNYYNDNNNADGNGEQQQEQQEINPQMAVTSRAMAFASLWTAVLASLMAVFGHVILGIQSISGQYYTCCNGNVHRTTPLSLGSFIGALLMFANLTLICSVLFGEFEIRDYPREGEERARDNESSAQNTALERSSVAFSIMCMFLTVLYAGFAAMTYAFSQSVLIENENTPQEYDDQARHTNSAYSGYIDNRFDVQLTSGTKTGFVAPQHSGDSSL